MNASSDGPYLLALVYLSESRRSQGAALEPLVSMLLERLAVARCRLVVNREDGLDPEAEAISEAEAEAFGTSTDRSSISTAFADPSVLSITALDPKRGDRTARIEVSAVLRYATGVSPAEQAPRTLHAMISVGRAGVPIGTALDAALEWVTACVSRLDVLHGGITVVPSAAEAVVEATLVGRDLPIDAERRWLYDSHRRQHLWIHARRLYWMTVLGPDLAARAGGASAARDAGADQVDEMAGSLLVRATSDPMDSLGAAFASRTAALRRWLWPHTVQNPVDADFESAVVILATVGRVVLESPSLGRRVLLVSLPEVAKGQTLRVAFPGVGERLVVEAPGPRNRTLVFDRDGQLVDDYTMRTFRRRPSPTPTACRS
jgi:hypothetical protein